MQPGMIYGSMYNIRVIVKQFCMCALRLRVHRMAEVLLIDGIANVKYRLDAKRSCRVTRQIFLLSMKHGRDWQT